MIKPYIFLGIAALLPIVLAVILFLLDNFTPFRKLNYWIKQVIYGVLFGGLAVVGTHWGIKIGGSVVNARDAAVIISGLGFGWPAGIISGVIGGVERFIVGQVMPDLFGFTKIACSVSTLLAGLVSALIRKEMYDDEIPSFISSFFLGLIIETFHLFMVFVTNSNEHVRAYKVINACTIPMIVANSLSVLLGILILQALEKGRGAFKKPDLHNMSHRIQFHLSILVITVFLLTTTFMSVFENRIAKSFIGGEYDEIVEGLNITKAELNRNIQIYVTTFILVIVFGLIFVLMFNLVKRIINRRVKRINDSLAKITSGDLDTVVDGGSTTEFKILAKDINETVDTLKGYIDAANKKIDEELKLATEIQLNTLPNVFPAFPNRTEFDIFASMHTAKKVGGDFYDFYFVNHDTFQFTLADVSGKGIPAALFMMRAKQSLKSLAQTNMPINEVYEKGNEALCEGNETSTFVSTWSASVDLNTGVMSFVNGGFNPPIIKHVNGKYEYVKGHIDLVLGALDGLHYKESQIQLQKGDIVYLYTDGVTEAINNKIEQFGELRLLNVLNKFPSTNCKDICEHVYKELNKFVGKAEQFDDITMLAFQYNGK